MPRPLYVIAALTMAALPSLSCAQPAMPTSSGPTIDPVKLELAREYMVQTHREALIRGILGKQLSLGMTFCRGKPCQSDLDEAIDKATGAAAHQNADELVQMYARTLSEADLKALVAFYASPEGQDIVRSVSQAEAEYARLGHALGVDVYKTVSKEFCPKHPKVCVTSRKR